AKIESLSNHSGVKGRVSYYKPNIGYTFGGEQGEQMGLPFRFLFLAAALPIVPALYPESPPNQTATPPFSISISLEQNVVKAGSEVRLDIVLTNTSDQNIVIAGWLD